MADDPELRRLLWYILGATRGGENRAKIIKAVKEQPGNLNQLSNRLGMDYRLVNHHIEVLTKNALVYATGPRYGRTYSLNPWLESHFEIFNEIVQKLRFKI